MLVNFPLGLKFILMCWRFPHSLPTVNISPDVLHAGLSLQLHSPNMETINSSAQTECHQTHPGKNKNQGNSGRIWAPNALALKLIRALDDSQTSIARIDARHAGAVTGSPQRAPGLVMLLARRILTAATLKTNETSTDWLCIPFAALATTFA